MRLSLRQRFLVAPIVGLIIVLALTASFLLQSENQNDLIEEISHSDLVILSVYTELFTDLSRYHQELYELFNSAGQSVDEGLLYDKGVVIIDNIFAITQQMEELINTSSGDDTLPESEAVAILSKIIEYRNAAISAVENTTVALSRAPIFLSRANEYFSILHEYFAQELDIVRNRIRFKAQQQLQETRRKTSTLGILGILSAIILIVTSFISAGLLSRQIRQYINDLYNLTENTDNKFELSNTSTDEIERLNYTIKVFKHSLNIIRDQESKLTQTNRMLQSEIEIKLKHEKELEAAKQDLEKRVAIRTVNLTEVNKELGQEIQQRIQAEERLRIYQEIILNTDEAIIVTEPDGTIIEANPAYERNTGYSREELIGNNPRIVRSGYHNDDFYRQMWQSIRERGHWGGEIWDRKRNGEIFPLWIVVNAIYDEKGEIQHLIGLYRDISELKQAEARLEQLAFYDPLTNLPNRTLFNEKVSQEIVSLKRHNEKMALLFLDLDNFKDVNDTLGHSVGDKLLIEVSRRLNDVLRDSDIVSRLSGDEFNIALSQLKESSDINRISNKIIDSVSAPYIINGESIKIGVSIGVSIYPDHSDHIETLKKYSDMAMYQAKSLGKNQLQIFTPELQRNREQRLDLENALVEAVDQRAFEMHFQPIIDIRTNKIVSAEALIRWTHNGELVPPEAFIPISEESDLIISIDLWVLEHVCQSVSSLNRQIAQPVSAHINLSSNFFQRSDTPSTIQNMLQKFSLDGSLLCLEITETAVISDAAATKQNISKIQKMGIQVALDDFGTGFSSLNYLTQFCMDKIKIDRSFIQNLHMDRSNQAVVDALIDLADRLDILVVSEGVELQQHHDYLMRAGCHFAQGNYYSKPMPETEFVDWIIDPKPLVL